MKKNTIQKVLSVTLMASMMLGITACGTSKTANTAGNDQTADVAAATETVIVESNDADRNTTADAATTPDAADEPVQTKPLVVYLNDFDAVIPDLFKEATGYDVEVVTGNGAETMSRIEAEKSNPQWDVVWIDSMYDVYNLSLDDCLLTEYEPENAAGLTEFSSSLVPENKCMYPTDIHAAGVIAYRTDVYSEEEAPKTYAELADAKYTDQIGMADPGVAAPAYPLAAYFMDSLGLDAGKEYFSTLFDQGLKVYPKNPQVVEALASGEISVAILQETNAYDMVSSGEPIGIIWPKTGAPGSTRVAAISKSTEQEEIAKIFVNFLLDPATQQALVNTGDEGYFEPSVEGVALKEERDADAKLAVADEVFGAENEADIKAWFADMSVQ